MTTLTPEQLAAVSVAVDAAVRDTFAKVVAAIEAEPAPTVIRAQVKNLTSATRWLNGIWRPTANNGVLLEDTPDNRLNFPTGGFFKGADGIRRSIGEAKAVSGEGWVLWHGGVVMPPAAGYPAYIEKVA